MKKKRKKHIPQKGTEKLDLKKQDSLTKKITQIANQLCEAEGFELVLVQWHGGGILRIYIDKPEGEDTLEKVIPKVTIDDCVLISRQLGDLLDVNIESEHSYTLEVSSPGINRPLVKENDFKRFEGKTIKLKTVQPVNDRKNFTGLLKGISKGIVKIMIDDNIFEIAYNNIKKARLVTTDGEN